MLARSKGFSVRRLTTSVEPSRSSLMYSFILAYSKMPIANSPGKELFDLAATGRLRVYVNVPQTYSRAATVGKAADLTLAEFPGRHFAGKIARTADAIDPVSRTLLTEVD